jgi:SAM-dependent methyltransferase
MSFGPASSLQRHAAPPAHAELPPSTADMAIESRFYDWRSAHLPARALRDVALYDSLARDVGGPILALGCGTGRVTAELAHRGHDVVGLDANPHALRIARERVARAGAKGSVELVQGDTRMFDLGRTFPLVVLAENSFQQLTDSAAQRDCLASVARHLSPAGCAIFELTRFEFEAQTSAGFEHRVTDFFEGTAAVVAMYERVRQDHRRQLTHFDERYVLFHPGVEPLALESTLTVRTVHRYEMELLLEVTGMRVRAVSDACDREWVDGPSPHTMLVVAERAD